MKRSTLRALKRIDRWLARISRTVKERLGYKPTWPILIAPYRGYGYGRRITLRGRVLKDRRIVKDEVNSTWRALINSYKRFYSREVAGAKVQVLIGGQRFTVRTDEEGYFFLDEELSSELPAVQGGCHEAELLLTETPRRKIEARAKAQLFVPKSEAKFGFISDIDDTVLQTDVTSLLKLRLLYHTLLKTASLRQSFGQATAFFQALRYGQSPQPVNPVFYVSNSPWNLYDLLEEFLSLNDLPEGPVLLRDFGLPYQAATQQDPRGHKHSSILHILNRYPDLPFVLIGDSAERDPYIYESIAREQPDRIAAIYIRDVRSLSRAKRIRRFIAETGVDMQLVDNYRQAAEDAARRGLLQWAHFERFMGS